MEAGYKIEKILLMECNFNRVANVTFSETGIKNNVDVSVDCEVKEEKVFVLETLVFERKYNDVTEVTAQIKMLGQFERVGDIKLSPEDFGKVNGAAILYPYIREQLSSLSLKAGIGNILLPTANFVKMNKVKESNTDK
jgi:preprotein translocase subunit SecB